mgnify:CR=1 FL=1
MNAIVKTTIDGMNCTVKGRFIKSKNRVIQSDGMFVDIQPTDSVEFLTTKKRETKIEFCPLDMHKWFRQSKQI